MTVIYDLLLSAAQMLDPDWLWSDLQFREKAESMFRNHLDPASPHEVRDILIEYYILKLKFECLDKSRLQGKRKYVGRKRKSIQRCV